MTTVLTLTEGADVAALKRALQARGLWASPLGPHDAASDPANGARPRQAAAFAIAGHSAQVTDAELAALPGVAQVLGAPSPHPALDAWRGAAVQVSADLRIGPGAPPVLAAGPCSVESPAQIHAAAAAVAAAGGQLLRGGAFKPRTSPYAFSGVGAEALGWLHDAATAHGLAVVTECLSERDATLVAAHADLIQIGSRNMQNFALLHAVGATGRPALLKRGVAATLAEWRLAAEHLLDAGAAGVVLCERGIRGVDGETRNTLDLGAVALLSQVDGLAVMVDPSHAAGRRDLVPTLARAALAAGAHGLLIESHPDPASARSDGPQALDAATLATLIHGGPS